MKRLVLELATCFSLGLIGAAAVVPCRDCKAKLVPASRPAPSSPDAGTPATYLGAANGK